MDESPKSCYCMGAGPQVSDMLRHACPDSARDHFRSARVEFLKGLRQLIDHRIASLSKEERKGTAVTVE